MYEQLSLYIDGEWFGGDGRHEQDVLNPATEDLLGRLPTRPRPTLTAPWPPLSARSCHGGRVLPHSLPYGLASFVFTTSSKTTHAISRSLEAGMVNINHFGMALRETPFGGIKDSGYGSEGGAETFDGYLNTIFITQLD